MASEATARVVQAQASNQNRRERAETGSGWLCKCARVCMQNEIKCLHLFLILYLCFGAFTFEKLAKFDCPNRTDSSINDFNNKTTPSSGDNADNNNNNNLLQRLDTAQRMWNITNQLNILYEANWTKLILAELESFESKLRDRFRDQVENQEYYEDVEEEEVSFGDFLTASHDELRSKQDAETTAAINKSDNDKKRPRRSRLDSLRRWFLYSLSTVAGMGFASEDFVVLMGTRCKLTETISRNHEQTVDRIKLFTILYGLLGLPLFIYGIFRSGDQLSLSTINFQLRVIHYTIWVPVYALRQLIRLMFCLCCCCYCCGLMAIVSSSILLRPCTKPQRPKLNLWKPPSKQSNGSDCASNNIKSRSSRSTKELQPVNQKGKSKDHKQKSVRFSPLRRDLSSHVDISMMDKDYETKTSDDVDDGCDNIDTEYFDLQDSIEYQKRLFRLTSSGRLAMASLVLLLVYLLIGAAIQAKYQHKSFVGGLFSSYQLVTTSNQLQSLDLSSRHKALRSKSLEQPKQDKRLTNNDRLDLLYDRDNFAIFECLYLWIGLNLLSCFLTAFKLKLESWRSKSNGDIPLNLVSRQQFNDDNPGDKYTKCNGSMIIMDTLEEPTNFMQTASVATLNLGSIAPLTDELNLDPKISNQYNNNQLSMPTNNSSLNQMTTTTNHYSPASSSNCSHHNQQVTSSMRQQQPTNTFNPQAHRHHHHHQHQLSELYVVDNEQHLTNNNMANLHNNLMNHSSLRLKQKSLFNDDNNDHHLARNPMELHQSNEQDHHTAFLSNNNFHHVNVGGMQQPSDQSLSVSSATTEKSSVCIHPKGTTNTPTTTTTSTMRSDSRNPNDDDDFDSNNTCRLIGPPGPIQAGGGHAILLSDANFEQDDPRSACNSRLVSSSSSQSLSGGVHQLSFGQPIGAPGFVHQQQILSVGNKPCAIHTLDRKPNNKNNNNNYHNKSNHNDQYTTGTIRPRQTSLSNSNNQISYPCYNTNHLANNADQQ